MRNKAPTSVVSCGVLLVTLLANRGTLFWTSSQRGERSPMSSGGLDKRLLAWNANCNFGPMLIHYVLNFPYSPKWMVDLCLFKGGHRTSDR